jgi:N-acetylneuraminic acid mutarotase
MRIHCRYFIISLLLLIGISGCSSAFRQSANTQSSLHLQTPRFGHAVVNDGQKIYVLAGANETGFLADIEIIDPLSGKTEVLPKHLIPRRYFSAVWDGQHSIYLIGGISHTENGRRLERRVEVFDTITHQVKFTQSLPAPTRINSAVYLNGKIFVFGGTGPTSRQNSKSKAKAITGYYDIALNRWIRVADMPTAKTTRAAVYKGQIFVIGGYDGSEALDVFERFDPTTNNWHSLPALPQPISAHSVTVAGDSLYVFGDYQELDSNYRYDFLKQQWQTLDIGYKASRHNAATTLANRIYVIGGNTGGNGPFLDYIQQFNL